MSLKVILAGFLVVSAMGSALAQTRHKTFEGRSPATTGSLGGAAGRGTADEASAPATELFGTRRTGRSTFNPTTARARHYER